MSKRPSPDSYRDPLRNRTGFDEQWIETSKRQTVELSSYHFLISIFYFFFTSTRAHEQRAHELEVLVNSCYYAPLPEVPSVHAIVTSKYYSVDGFEVGSEAAADVVLLVAVIVEQYGL